MQHVIRAVIYLFRLLRYLYTFCCKPLILRAYTGMSSRLSFLFQCLPGSPKRPKPRREPTDVEPNQRSISDREPTGDGENQESILDRKPTDNEENARHNDPYQGEPTDLLYCKYDTTWETSGHSQRDRRPRASTQRAHDVRDWVVFSGVQFLRHF